MQQENASVSEMKSSFDIDLSVSALNAEQKEVAHNFLSQWQPIFSQGPRDLGNTDLVQHTINLEDDKPFKEPYRNIRPALIQEVHEHLREIIEVETIRGSSSPYSSNVAIIRKNLFLYRKQKA